MSDKPAPSDATIQMNPEEVARLHRQLAGEAAAAAPAAAELAADPADTPTARGRPAPIPAAAPARAARPSAAAAPVAARPTTPARPAQPQAARPAQTGSASLPVMLGAVGAFLALAGFVLLFLPQIQGFGHDTDGAAYLTVGVAHLLLAVGLFAAAPRTSGVAIFAGIFAILTSLAFVGAFLMEARIMRSMDLGFILIAAVGIIPGLTWLLTGIWGFAGLRRLSPPLGLLVGIFGVIGGLAGAAGGIMLLLGVTGGMEGDDSLAELLALISSGGIALAAVLTAIAMISKVARAPKYA